MTLPLNNLFLIKKEEPFQEKEATSSKRSGSFYPFGHYSSLIPLSSRVEKIQRLHEMLMTNEIFTTLKLNFFTPQILLAPQSEFEQAVLSELARTLKKMNKDPKILSQQGAKLNKIFEELEFFSFELSPSVDPAFTKCQDEKAKIRENSIKLVLDAVKQRKFEYFDLLEEALLSSSVHLCPLSLFTKAVLIEFTKKCLHQGALSEEKIAEESQKLFLILKKAEKSFSKEPITIREEKIERIIQLFSKAKETGKREMGLLEEALLSSSVIFCTESHFEASLIKEFQAKCKEHDIPATLLNPFFEWRLNLIVKRVHRQMQMERIGRLVEPESKEILEKIFKDTYLFTFSDANFEKAVVHHYTLRLAVKKEPEIVASEVKKLKEVIHNVRLSLKNGVEPLSKEERKKLMDFYDVTQPIPEDVLIFDVSEPHTLDKQAYVDARVSRMIVRSAHMAKKSCQPDEKPIEIFFGPIDEMKKYYAAKGYRLNTRLATDSSNYFYLFKNEEENHQMKVVVHRIANMTRLTHLLLELKCSGIDLNDVCIRGSIEVVLEKIRRDLTAQFKQTKPHIVFMGSRSQVLVQLAIRLYPKEMAKAKKRSERMELAMSLLSKHEHKQVNIQGVVAFSTVKVNTKEGVKTIVALRMPNGDLAYEVTKILIEAGAQHFIMIGVAGSLNPEAHVGDYQLIHTSSYRDKSVTLAPDKKMKLEVPGLHISPEGVNDTVDSPLIETERWYNKKRKDVSCADVESYHILRAIEESQKQIRVFPGDFISDVINEKPLTQKIDDELALQGFPNLFNTLLDNLEVVKELDRKETSPHFHSVKALSEAYLKDLEAAHKMVECAFKGKTLEERLKATEELLKLKKEFFRKLFVQVIKPAIEDMMKEAHEKKTFDEIGVICGFNRLFTRHLASLFTSADFLIFMDVKNGRLMEEIQRFLEQEIKPYIQQFGVDINTARALKSDKKTYFKELSNFSNARNLMTYSSSESRVFLAGSQKLTDEIFTLSDEQIAQHTATLLLKYSPKDFVENYPTNSANEAALNFSEKILQKRIFLMLKKNQTNRNKLTKHLQRIACFDTYLAKKPLNGKETMQSYLDTLSLREDVHNRVIPFSIELGLNCFVDMFYVSKLYEINSLSHSDLSEMVAALEKLSVLLSNMVNRLNGEENSEISVLRNGLEISCEDLATLTPIDRSLITELLAKWNFNLDPEAKDFAENCFDALWKLSFSLLSKVKLIEHEILTEAKNDFLKK